MKVKCTNKGRSMVLEHGKEYEASILEYWIDGTPYSVENFELIKEDKMEETRVVRKLEDLDGLENGFGLKVNVYGHPLMIEVSIPFEDNIVLKKIVDKCGVETIHQIKAMGFKFKYKPLRTEQEVKKEIMSLESLSFTQEKVNYYVDYNSLINKYLVICDSVNGHGLHIYMSEWLAQKYADELNEIIGVGK